MKMAIPHGVYPTMITPFTEKGVIDFEAVDQIVDWYIERDVAGIFAVCQSSEMFYLDEEERVALASRVVKAAAGRVAVVVSGHVSDGFDDQVRELSRMQETGADGVVLVSNRLAGAEEGDDVMLSNMEALLRALPQGSLGMYECPQPYKRLLSNKVLSAMADSGRFTFVKDTCCDADLIARRTAILNGRVALFNANSATLLESLRAGAAGFSGIMANLHPELYVWLCNHYGDEPERAENLAAFLSLASGIERGAYPICAKYHMGLMGLPVGLYSRCQTADRFTPGMAHEIRDLLRLEKLLIPRFAND